MKNIVDQTVKKYLEKIKTQCLPADYRLYRIFENTYLNTLQDAVVEDKNKNIFVLTGDIPAMWLRDSAAQLYPYLYLAKQDNKIKNLIVKVIQKQFFYINIDPYANAFNEYPNSKGRQDDNTKMGPWIWERKYELDSLCYPVRLAYALYKNTGEIAQFDSNFITGIKKILHVMNIEQHHNSSPYFFERLHFKRARDKKTGSLLNNGRGTPVSYTGMIWSGFRPSDDACHYGYLIPSNMFAVVILDYIKNIFCKILPNKNICEKAQKIKTEVLEGIKKYGVVNYKGKKIYAYEVDGRSHYNLMDDSNIPSLLSAPYLGFLNRQNNIYQNTKKFLFSSANPYFYIGEFYSGQGSPHTPKGYIWPLAIAMLGLTSNNKDEQRNLLYILANTTNNTNQIHESFNANDPSKFTRPWFSWANMLYCELLLKYLGYTLN